MMNPPGDLRWKQLNRYSYIAAQHRFPIDENELLPIFCRLFPLAARKKLIKNCCFLGCKLGCIGACFNERKCNPMYQHNALKSSTETVRMHRHDALRLMNNAWNHARKYLHCTWNFERVFAQHLPPLASPAHPIIVADFLCIANWFFVINFIFRRMLHCAQNKSFRCAYINFDSGVEEESFSGRMLKRRVSVELEDASVPFHRVEGDVVHFVVAVQLCALTSSYHFRVYCQS